MDDDSHTDVPSSGGRPLGGILLKGTHGERGLPRSTCPARAPWSGTGPDAISGSLGPRLAASLWPAPAVPPSVARARGCSPGHTHQRELKGSRVSLREGLGGRKRLIPLGPRPCLPHTQVTAVSSRVRHMSGALATVSHPTESSQDRRSLSRG